MPKLEATEAALVADQHDRVLSAVLKAYHDGEELTWSELKDRLGLEASILNATLTQLHDEGLVDQV